MKKKRKKESLKIYFKLSTCSLYKKEKQVTSTVNYKESGGLFGLPSVALSIFFDEMLAENWSFSGHKSDFKADQKIRKAMFSAGY